MFPSSFNNWCLFTPMRKQEFVSENESKLKLILCESGKSDNVMHGFRQPNTEDSFQLD